MQIQIGPIAYQIVDVDELYGPDGRRCGECDAGKARIRIDTEIDPQVREVTIWHEVFHAILFGAGIPCDQHDERQIDALAYGLVQVMHDNPTIVPAVAAAPARRAKRARAAVAQPSEH